MSSNSASLTVLIMGFVVLAMAIAAYFKKADALTRWSLIVLANVYFLASIILGRLS